MTHPMILDLSAVPLIDGHCHSIFASFQESSFENLLRIFTEAVDDRLIVHHVPHSLTYRRALRDIAAFLGCTPTPALVIEARRQRPDYLSALCRECRPARAAGGWRLSSWDAHSQPEMFWLGALYGRWDLSERFLEGLPSRVARIGLMPVVDALFAILPT